MEIRCKKTKRFLVNIDIEKYVRNLEKIGIKQEIPLEIIIPCPRCHKKEEYAIYPTHYEFIKNHETTIKVDSSVIVDK
jgi:hypothetical protein